jgi:hypothetical protein
MILSYHIIQQNVALNLTGLRVQSLIDHGLAEEYGYFSPDVINGLQEDVEKHLSYGSIAVTINYQDRPAGYILYHENNNILTIGNFFTRHKDRMDDPPCPYGFGKSLLHKTILDHPQAQKIKLQSSCDGLEFYKKMGFEMYNPYDEYDMIMPRKHIEMWLDTPLYDKRPIFTPD